MILLWYDVYKDIFITANQWQLNLYQHVYILSENISMSGCELCCMFRVDYDLECFDAKNTWFAYVSGCSSIFWQFWCRKHRKNNIVLYQGCDCVCNHDIKIGTVINKNDVGSIICKLPTVKNELLRVSRSVSTGSQHKCQCVTNSRPFTAPYHVLLVVIGKGITIFFMRHRQISHPHPPADIKAHNNQVT